ncbi:D-alanyl-lipoteichoic acid acyltransferase DltB, MBOAT superfamily [Rhizobiales bacterium GAS191]|jgi:alginate O-acetyltransferase complex protein AlgI|nr:D-alanyl-lipoteichoic acid acyltransferase DltB, MBOAT superfamily [Rhizobiales bacterium GAS113]SEE17653.1 D-alanyl-lipoteichoic acid acyltransferase DltB, MBOAT superfamily [Rhizobiales bacterium GAS191]SEE37794.1 D-alanyl-lipoteichoic acid acyltransferase DltB, MBOAT superfamily [Rhizobiales bacterium GAS188]
MLFQSQEFILLFLPLLLICYYLVANSVAARQIVLLCGSLFFYGWWDVRFIPLLIVQVTLTWLLALAQERTGRRAFLIIGIVLNLASLATFKYLDFLIGSTEALLGTPLPRAGIVLPIGISFFSFQLISYLVDRMRGDAPIYPFRQFSLFVMVFPHLIAGPIVRHNELVPQFAENPLREGAAFRFSAGLTLFTLGLAKKVLLTERLAKLADPLFAAANDHALNFGEAWTATLAFSLQLFLDFSAYTEMAIGIALMFGLLLPENFRRPYLAVDLRDFWRRWHISLSSFIRDYLYIPLGGSRRGVVRYVIATLGAMGLCGLWHGAGWTYVAWGLWHGVGLIICHAYGWLKRPLPVGLSWFLTLLFVLAGWVLFRAPSFTAAASILASLAGLHGLSGSIKGIGPILIAAAVSVLIPSAHEIKDRWLRPDPWLAVALASLAVYCVLEVGRGPPIAFIYFRF